MRQTPTILMFSYVAVTIAACDEHGHTVTDPCGEPTYEGEASDEAWYAMVDAYDLAASDHPDRSVFTVPTAGEVLTGETPVALTWTSPLALGCPVDCFRDGYAMPYRLPEEVAVLAARARAHLPPVTGEIHYLEVEVPGRECPIRAITTLEQWRPKVAEWAELKGKGPLGLTLTSAYLEKNRVSEGPFRTRQTFEVQ